MFLDECGIIYIMVETISEYKKVKRKLQSELNRDPLPEEIAAEMKIDVDKVFNLIKLDQERVSTMDKIKYWLRWIAVFPGALLSGLLATFPLHWILYFNFANGDIISGVNIEPIEYVLYPFVFAFAFILGGYEIAPKYKFKTAIILFGFYLGVWSILNFIALFEGSIYEVNIRFSGRTILALAGAIIGLYAAKKANKGKN